MRIYKVLRTIRTIRHDAVTRSNSLFLITRINFSCFLCFYDSLLHVALNHYSSSSLLSYEFPKLWTSAHNSCTYIVLCAAVLRPFCSGYSIRLWLSLFNRVVAGGVTPQYIKLAYLLHSHGFVSRTIPFPYSFGSRVGYYSIHCYLAPISVSPFRGVFCELLSIPWLFKQGRTIQQFACCFSVRIGLVVWLVVSSCFPALFFARHVRLASRLFNAWRSHNSTLFALFTYYSC